MNIKKGEEKNIKAYLLDLLQAKAYRATKSATNRALEDHDIGATDWAILGALKNAGQPILFGDLARMIGVTAPRVTTIMNDLSANNWISIEIDPSDNRRKHISLSKDGQKFLTATEKQVSKETDKLFAGVAERDFVGFVRTLEQITKEDEEK